MGTTNLQSENEKERVLLVGVQHGMDEPSVVEDSLNELEELAYTDEAEVVDHMIFKQKAIHPGYYIGKGKVEQIAQMAEDLDVHTVIFDDDLSPAQGRNIENICKAKVVDRTQVILDIFSLHAATREGRLQVELARLEYLLPRLRRMWTHLERQRGGIGVRGGPGEQQIEVDRRRVQERIVRMRRELERVRRHRHEQRRGRRRHGWALISIVGYTNAGKSTLLNKLTGSEVTIQDQLFVTLDPTTREIELPNQQSALLTDTVGFIKKLPHHLVDAFKATLEEVVEADLLLHVIDASHPNATDHIKAVESVLGDLGVHDKTTVAVLNKMDRDGFRTTAPLLRPYFKHVVQVSAKTGEGTESLRQKIADLLRDRNIPFKMRIPMSEAKLISLLQGAANIIHEEFGNEYYEVDARIPKHLIGACKPFVINPDDQEETWTGE